MADRRRNHFIPRFLLARFASRRDGKKTWIWQVSPEGEAIEIGTRSAGVATDFYGSPETGVEDAFSVAEGRFAQALLRIQRGESICGHVGTLKELFWTLAIRTRALRNQFAGVTQGLVSALVDTLTIGEGRRNLIDELVSRAPEALEKEVQKLPAADQGSLREELGRPEEVVGAFLQTGLLEQFFDTIRDRAQDPKGGLQEAAAEGQIEGLSRILGEGGVPASFDPGFWETYQVDDGPLILGDGCVVALKANGQFGGIASRNGDWQSLYLPISSSQVLVASRQETVTRFDGAALNRASAGLSDSYFYSSAMSEELKALGRTIGSIALLLDDEEIQALARGAWEK